MERIVMRVIRILDVEIDFDRQKAKEHLEFLVSQHACDEELHGTRLAAIEHFAGSAGDRCIFEFDFREHPNLDIEIEYERTPVRSPSLINLNELLRVMEHDEILIRLRDNPLVRIKKDDWVEKSSLSRDNLAKWETGDCV